MNKLLISLWVGVTLIFVSYSLIPNPEFPDMPRDSVQSKEPADTETQLRRAYFTNLTREEIIAHYQKEFNRGTKLPTLRLNYPPEEAQVIIRDQTRSTFLEELVHLFRESLFINGFEPLTEKDTIIIDGVNWRQKVIVKYVPSSIMLRTIAVLLSSLSVFMLIKEYKYAVKN
jgi:hypothetical protein